MRVNASWLLSRLDPQDERHAVVQTLAQQCEDLQVDIRGLLRRLRPLEFSGIESATLPLQTLQMLLHTLVDNWVRLEIDRCTIRLDCPEEPSDLAVPEGIALAIYRMTQEALTNIARHAQARHATVALRIESQTDGTGMLLIWSVSDDGRGLHEPLSSGHGLQGMRERAQAQGAELHLRSGGRSVATGSAVAARSTGPSSSSGLTLEAVFPWRPRAHPRFPQSGSGSFP
jgi:two-component system sensor histidine kinase UhpB